MQEAQLKETEIQFQRDRNNLLNQLETVRRKNRDLEDQLSESAHKNDSLYADLRHARDGIEDLERRYNDLEKRYQLEQADLNDHILELGTLLKKTSQERNDLQDEVGRNKALINDQELQIREFEDNQRDLLKKINQLTQELDKVSTLLAEREDENEELKARMRDLELDYVRRLEQQRENLENIRKEDIVRLLLLVFLVYFTLSLAKNR